MANLFENLYGLYGDREILHLAAPAGYRLFPSASFTCGDCLHFTNLAAEAFIRDLDLKKGERVVLCMSEPAELLLVAVALVKSGGVVVPLDNNLPAADIAQYARGCGATLAVMGADVLAERADLANGIPGVERMMVSGPRERTPQGSASLDKAMDSSSGFFLPYTLKPSNVIGLFHTLMRDGTLKAVMATNEGLLGPQLRAVPFFPTHPGDPCVCAASLRSMAGFTAAMLGLCMGWRLHLLPHAEPEKILAAMEDVRPAAFLGNPEVFTPLLQADAPGCSIPPVRLWFSAGGPLPRQVVDAFRGWSSPRSGSASPSAGFVEAFDAGGNASMLALKPALAVFPWPEDCPGSAIPPNRMDIVDEEGKPQRRGEAGELVIRGPAVTPGYWNDVEGTMAAKSDGWFRTGIPATKHHYLITLL